MKCPACSSELSPVKANNVVIEACRGGCGGLWFDQDELAKFDQESKPISPTILRAEKNALVPVDHSRTRKCPKCPNEALSMHYYDSEQQIEVDECMRCGGMWLDLGELSLLREQKKAAAQRQNIVDRYEAEYSEDLKKGTLPARVAAVFKIIF